MALASGTHLGPYEVLAPIGAGGMGDVYRARDTRLDRDVALKALPDHLSDDRAALARFRSETKAVAALSHPNILAIFDVGEANGTRYAVTELLEGQTLRDALVRGPLGVRRSLEVAEQMALGLAAAHENGIVHHDVKPENVFLTRDGHVKLLDLGLARRPEPIPGDDGTRSPTAPLGTATGGVVGTVGYMAPEQARGEPVDHRADQFALGLVLYEMLAGKRAFRRDTVPETLAAILRDEPEPLQQAAPETPPPVRFLVERLLAKDPADRYDSTRDLARDLETWRLHGSGTEAGSRPGASPRPRRASRWLRWGVSLGLAAGLGVVALVLTRRPAQSTRTERFEIVLPEGYRLFTRGGLDLAPDGKTLVYAAFTWKRLWVEPDAPVLFLHSLERFESRPIPGTEDGSGPRFSPDGRRIAFLTSSGTILKTVPVEGGPATTVREGGGVGVSFTPDGAVLAGALLGPLRRLPWGEGRPEPVTALDAGSSEVSHRLPHLLKDGRTVVYTALRHDARITPDGGRIYAQRLGERTRHLLVEGGTDGRFLPPDLLLFGRRGTLMVARVDPSTWKVTAAPTPLIDGVAHLVYSPDTGWDSGLLAFAASPEGPLAYVPGSVVPERRNRLAWLDREGRQTPLDVPPGRYEMVRISPDGRLLLVSNGYPGRPVQLLDLERGSRRDLTFNANFQAAIWGPGPDRFTVASDEGGPVRLSTHRLTGPAEESETLTTGAETLCAPGSWSPDGRVLSYVVHQGDTFNHDVWLLERGRLPRPFLATRFYELCPEISPDGRDLLYGSYEAGRPEVFVRPLDGSAGPVQVSAGGGVGAVWARDGASVYYVRPVAERPGVKAILRVPVRRARGGLALGRPEQVVEGQLETSIAVRSWDVAPDGRFLVIQPPPDADNRDWWERTYPNRIRVVLGGIASLLRETGNGR